MQSNTRKNTTPELELRALLHARGLRYKVDARGGSVKYAADLIFTQARIAVFVDGCFWHACPLHWSLPATRSSYWLDKARANRARDRAATKAYVAEGWVVLRIWEHNKSEFPALAEQIFRMVKERGSK